MKNLGLLKVVDPRTAWPDEARDFTPWLANNIQMLGEALGLDLVVDKREADIGDFSLDLLARDLSTGHTVVIENQLTSTIMITWASYSRTPVDLMPQLPCGSPRKCVTSIARLWSG